MKRHHFSVPGELIRIISDVHYGDRSSRVERLEQLRPLCEGVSTLVLNGDTLDTRKGPYPLLTARYRAEVGEFFAGAAPAVLILTGNHDPNLSSVHALDLAGGEVFVTHGDILFRSIVPWGRDAAVIGERMAAALAARPAANRPLEDQLEILRLVAASIPQRHQSERNGLKYAVRFAMDCAWPPHRLMKVLRTWRDLPALASALAARHRPRARFAVEGHTHRPGVWRTPSGVVVVNTGSFCRPFGGIAVDVEAHRLVVRKLVARGGDYRPGKVVAQFPLSGL